MVHPTSPASAARRMVSGDGFGRVTEAVLEVRGDWQGGRFDNDARVGQRLVAG
jgi:hypothetical protein